MCGERIGMLKGTLGAGFGPEEMVRLGAELGARGRVALGHWGGQGAAMLARAAGAGVTAAGGMVLSHELRFPAGSAWLSGHYRLPCSLFIQQAGGEASLYLFDGDGVPVARDWEQVLIRRMAEPGARPGGERVGTWEHFSGAYAQYTRHAAAAGRLAQRSVCPVTVSVPQDSQADRALADTLRGLGCTVLREERPGVAAFSVSRGGFALLGRDEKGTPLTPERLLTLVCLIEMENGDGKVAVPPSAPAAVEVTAAGLCGTVLRLDRDGAEARRLYVRQPWLRDACFAAARICARLGLTGESLHSLDGKAPRFASASREVAVSADPGDLLSALAEQFPSRDGGGHSVRLRAGSGWVSVSPLGRRGALRVAAECADMELAEELCAVYVQKLARLDKALGQEK